MSMNKPTGSEGKGESVAERAVRAYFAGFIYGKRQTLETAFTTSGDCTATMYVYITKSAIDTMLRREKSQKREKARAKNDPGGYIGEALASIGSQRKQSKNTKRKGTL